MPGSQRLVKKRGVNVSESKSKTARWNADHTFISQHLRLDPRKILFQITYIGQSSACEGLNVRSSDVVSTWTDAVYGPHNARVQNTMQLWNTSIRDFASLISRFSWRSGKSLTSTRELMSISWFTVSRKVDHLVTDIKSKSKLFEEKYAIDSKQCRSKSTRRDIWCIAKLLQTLWARRSWRYPKITNYTLRSDKMRIESSIYITIK